MLQDFVPLNGTMCRSTCVVTNSLMLIYIITHLQIHTTYTHTYLFTHSVSPGPDSIWIIQPITRLNSLNCVPDWDMLCSLLMSHATPDWCVSVCVSVCKCIKETYKCSYVSNFIQQGILIFFVQVKTNTTFHPISILFQSKSHWVLLTLSIQLVFILKWYFLLYKYGVCFFCFSLFTHWLFSLLSTNSIHSLINTNSFFSFSSRDARVQ